jgi:Tfp pilus assembly protein PilO
VDESRKLLLTLVVVVVALGLIGAGLYHDNKQLKEARVQLEEKKTREAALRTITDVRLPQAREALATKRELVALYMTTLPSATEIESMDETLNQYKDESGVNLTERRPVRTATAPAEEQSQSYYRYSYNLSLEGDFFSWVHFMRLLETHQRFVQIDEFDVRKTSDDPEVLDVKMKISTFSYAKVRQPDLLEEETPAPDQPPSTPQSSAGPQEGES